MLHISSPVGIAMTSRFFHEHLFLVHLRGRLFRVSGAGASNHDPLGSGDIGHYEHSTKYPHVPMMRDQFDACL